MKPEWKYGAALLTGLFLSLMVMALAPGCGDADDAAVTAPPATNELADTAASGRLAGVSSWMYQIQDQDVPGNLRRLADSPYGLLVVDQTRSLKGDEEHDSAADVSRLKEGAGAGDREKLVVCYLDVGQAEDYRSYWHEGWRVGSPEWIAAEDPDGWEGNFPVIFWRPEWKEIVKQRLDQIIDDGYDGAYLDWLEIYDFGPVAEAARAEGLEPEEELAGFVDELASYARSRRPGFILIAQNAAELGSVPGYIDTFDAIAQEAVWFDGAGDPDTGEEPGDVPVEVDLTQEYLSDLKRWQKQGKTVFDVEYAARPENARAAYELGREQGFVTLVTTRPLDSLTATPPPSL